MQVQLDSSVWHRKAVGGGSTACGLVIHYATIAGMRQEAYTGELCPDCFSKHELEVLAPKARDRERYDTDRELKKLDDDRKKMFDDLRTKRTPKKGT